MEKQINFKNIRLLNLKFLFRRFFWHMHMHRKYAFKAVILSWYSPPCRRTVSSRKEMCQKLKIVKANIDNNWMRKKAQNSYLWVLFNLRFLLHRLQYYVEIHFLGKACPTRFGQDQGEQSRNARSCIQEHLKSIISLQSSRNMTSQHFGNPFDTKTLPTLMKNRLPVNWNTAQNHQTQHVAKR